MDNVIKKVSLLNEINNFAVAGRKSEITSSDLVNFSTFHKETLEYLYRNMYIDINSKKSVSISKIGIIEVFSGFKYIDPEDICGYRSTDDFPTTGGSEQVISLIEHIFTIVKYIMAVINLRKIYLRITRHLRRVKIERFLKKLLEKNIMRGNINYPQLTPEIKKLMDNIVVEIEELRK